MSEKTRITILFFLTSLLFVFSIVDGQRINTLEKKIDQQVKESEARAQVKEDPKLSGARTQLASWREKIRRGTQDPAILCAWDVVSNQPMGSGVIQEEDPWGNYLCFVYTPNGVFGETLILVRSFGPDGKRDTTDDLVESATWIPESK